MSDERRDYVYVAFRRARSSRAIAREARGESIAIASDRRRRPAVGGRTRLRARATMRARRARDARMRLKCFDRSARDDGRIARGTRLTTRALDVFARAGFRPADEDAEAADEVRVDRSIEMGRDRARETMGMF